jgi:hypothetical protein
LLAGPQYFAKNPNEISAFDPKLELRNIQLNGEGNANGSGLDRFSRAPEGAP